MQKTLFLSLLLLLSSVVLANPDGDTPPPPKNSSVDIKRDTRPSPRGLFDVVAVATIADAEVVVTFTEPLGDVTLTLSDTTGVVDFVVTDTADGPVSMLLPLEAVGEITITITDAAGSQYIGVFTYNY